MTLTLALLLQRDVTVGNTVVIVLFMLGVGVVAGVLGYRFFQRPKPFTVPPEQILVLRSKRSVWESHNYKLYYPGDKLPKQEDLTIATYYLAPQTDLVGKHAITWRIDRNNFERYLHGHAVLPSIADGKGPLPIRNFRALLEANPAINFLSYASEYGIEVLKVEPPIVTPTPPTDGVGIGVCYCHKDNVFLWNEDRKQHAYIAGKTKSGKSTLLYNMALQDIRQGRGVAFIDPHGDTVNQLLAAIPKERAGDVIYLSGSHPIPLNIMEARSDTEKEILADDIYTLIRGMSDTWGERMDAILTNTLRALMDAGDCSFIDIYHFLSDLEFRQRVLRRVENPAIQRFWDAYHPPNYPRGSEQPILSRMEKFVTRPTLATILGSSSGIDLYDVMQSGKILLVDTSRRSMGQQTGAVLGGLIVTKLYQTAMRRADIPEAQRRPFYLYVDEFQSFIATKTELILSETRKYGISMTLAHQYLSQIDETSRKAIFGNVGTMMFFQLGYDDAKYLAHQLGGYTVESILNLSIDEHQAIVRPANGAAKSYMIRTHPPAKAAEDLSASILSSQPNLHPPAPPKTDDDDEVEPGVMPPQ